MADPKAQSLHDFAILTIINVFGLFYFYLFVIHFLLFYFPSTPGGILDSLSVLAFCAGVIVWCLSSLFYRFLDAFGGNDAAEWQKLEFRATLVLIWAATLPSVVVLFRTEPCLQLGYLAAFTVVAVGILVDFVVSDPSVCAVQYQISVQLRFTGLTFAHTNYLCPDWDAPKSARIGGTLRPNRHRQFSWSCVLSASSVREDWCSEWLAA